MNFYANSNKLLPKPKLLLEAYIKRPKNYFWGKLPRLERLVFIGA